MEVLIKIEATTLRIKVQDRTVKKAIGGILTTWINKNLVHLSRHTECKETEAPDWNKRTMMVIRALIASLEEAIWLKIEVSLDTIHEMFRWTKKTSLKATKVAREFIQLALDNNLQDRAHNNSWTTLTIWEVVIREIPIWLIQTCHKTCQDNKIQTCQDNMIKTCPDNKIQTCQDNMIKTCPDNKIQTCQDNMIKTCPDNMIKTSQKNLLEVKTEMKTCRLIIVIKCNLVKTWINPSEARGHLTS